MKDELEISDHNYSHIEKGEEIGAIGKTNAMNPIEQDKTKLDKGHTSRDEERLWTIIAHDTKDPDVIKCNLIQ